MTIKELKIEIEKQKNINKTLYDSIPIASHEDPNNEKAEPALKEWRNGSTKLKAMLQELRGLELENKKPIIPVENKIFVNGYGEATTRKVTSSTYERAEKRLHNQIVTFIS